VDSTFGISFEVIDVHPEIGIPPVLPINCPSVVYEGGIEFGPFEVIGTEDGFSVVSLFSIGFCVDDAPKNDSSVDEVDSPFGVVSIGIVDISFEFGVDD